MNQPCDVFRLRFYVASQVTVNELLMKPETHYISKKKSYKDWRKQTPYT